mgnify:CR=1 FL=1
MKIVAITRYKQGSIYSLLGKLGWSQSELGRRSGLGPQMIGHIINLRHRPTEAQANKIQNAFGEAGEYIDVMSEWPETFVGLKPGFKREQIEDIEFENLLECDEAMSLPSPEYEEPKTFEEMTKNLTNREFSIINSRFNENKTLERAGLDFGITRERVRQLEGNAIRKMRDRMRRNMNKE